MRCRTAARRCTVTPACSTSYRGRAGTTGRTRCSARSAGTWRAWSPRGASSSTTASAPRRRWPRPAASPTRCSSRHAHSRRRRGPRLQGVRTCAAAWRSCALLALCLTLLDLALELLHDVRVAQRGDVAQLAALGDVAQQPAHDLARARLRKVVGPDDALGPRQLADALGHVLADLVHELVGRLVGALERDERGHRLAGVLVGLPDARRLGDLRVRDDRRLDLRRRHAVAGDVDDVVDAPDDPEE